MWCVDVAEPCKCGKQNELDLYELIWIDLKNHVK